MLKVWLPLDGDLRNLGASSIEVTNNGATVDNTGKIGKCYYFDGNAHYLQLSNSVGNLYSGDFSWAVWLKPTDSTRSIISSEYSSTGSSNVAFELTASRGVRIYWNGSPDIYPANSTLPINTWTHVAITKTTGTIKTYLNGQLTNTYTGTLSDRPSTSKIRIGDDYRGGTSVSYMGYMNDWRLYDHCLSAAEVHEIAMGLVLHYKLNNQYETGLKNKYSPTYSDGELSSCSWVKTKLSEERGWNYHLERTGNGTNSWPSGGLPAYSFTIGKKYIYSAKVRCNTWSSGTLSLRASRSANDWVTYSIVVCSPTLADGKWHEYNVSQIVNETYDRSGTTVTCAPVLEFYCSNQNGNGTIYSMDFDLKDLQVVESDSYIPFIDNTMISTTITDSSGYNHNGTLVSPLPPDTISPRYNVAYQFSGNVAHRIYCNTTNFNYTDNFSWACWMKANHTGTAAQYLFTIGRADAGGRGYGIYNISDNTIRLMFGTSYYDVTITKNNWHHIAFTKSGNTIKIYKDGTLYSTNTFSGTLPTYSDGNGLGIGCFHYSGDIYPSYGAISDFRIYCTPLLDNDIKMLYNVGMKVDNLGGIHTFEFDEINSNPKLFKTGIFKNQFFIEDGYEFNQGKGWSFTAAGTRNSCAGNVIADFSNIATLKQSITLQIECDVNWSNINVGTESGAGGWFQGSNRKLDGTWKWEGTNYAHPGTNLTSLLKANATGSTHIKVQRTIPASWFDTYNGSNISFRTDYTTGTITLSNLKVTLVPEKFKINSVYLASNNFIEI